MPDPPPFLLWLMLGAFFGYVGGWILAALVPHRRLKSAVIFVSAQVRRLLGMKPSDEMKVTEGASGFSAGVGLLQSRGVTTVESVQLQAAGTTGSGASDVSQALKDAENAVRDFVGYVLGKELGPDWIERCGVTPERLAAWRGRKQTEEKRQRDGPVAPRLIEYSDFYDLETILQKHWNHFSDAFGEQKKFLALWDELKRLRDPDAHRRELLPHQKQLIVGISGQVRNLIVRYRSSLETSDSYYPRIESVMDNLGNTWVPTGRPGLEMVPTKNRLRVGDVLEFIVKASDPLGGSLEFGLGFHLAPPESWQASECLRIVIGAGHVGRDRSFGAFVRSKREFHSHGHHDGVVLFTYEVLPPT
jgi:hypothetical protein